jgi:glycosyltransferase involved in cell wall biosynthesis
LVPIFTDWANKQADFVWIGRITPSKRLETAINIVGRLRESGLHCKLHVVGNAIDKGYEARIRELAHSKGDWVVLEGPLYGPEKARFLSRFRYAIHTQENEAFGITLVELIKSGCILFGPDSCGGAEILDHDDLLFKTEEEAVRKILRVIQEPRRMDALRSHLLDRADCFSCEQFCRSVQQLVARFLEEKSDQFIPGRRPIEIGAGAR